MDFFASVFWKSKHKTTKEKGYQGTNYKKSYPTKAKARQAAQNEINIFKKKNPEKSKHLQFSAHVATKKTKPKKKPNSFWSQFN